MKENPRIVFMGTTEFALVSLKKLHESHYNIVGVVTLADKLSGRGRKLSETAIKKWSQDKDIPILQPENLKDLCFLDSLKAWKGDIHVVVAFRMLPKEVWAMPALGTFNLHASLLPNYRGAAPINHAIINGEKITGVTTFFINENIDTGNILLQKSISISPEDTAGHVSDSLAKIGSTLVIETIELIYKKQFKALSQPLKGDFPVAPKLTPEYTHLDWGNSLDDTYNKIRGLSPYPTAWTQLYFDETTSLRLKIFSAKKQRKSHEHSTGCIIINPSDFEMKIALKDGYLILVEAQLEGRSKMLIKDLINGFKKHPLYAY